jgi:hypothetical protein
MPVAIVLSGGGTQGDFEIGAVRAMYNRGIFPAVLASTSVGSMIAVKLAEDATSDAALRQVEQIWFDQLSSNSDVYVPEVDADQATLGHRDCTSQVVVVGPSRPGGWRARGHGPKVERPATAPTHVLKPDPIAQDRSTSLKRVFRGRTGGGNQPNEARRRRRLPQIRGSSPPPGPAGAEAIAPHGPGWCPAARRSRRRRTTEVDGIVPT